MKSEPHFDPEYELIDFIEDAIVLPENLQAVLKMIFRGYGGASLEWKNKFYPYWLGFLYVHRCQTTRSEDY